MFIRKIKSRNGNQQIQVVQKVGRDNRVVKHLGTARNELELKQLIDLASNFIEGKRIESGKLSLFDNRYSQSEMRQILSRFHILKVLDSVKFDFLNHFYHLLNFDGLKDDCFRDLVIARIIFPASKAKTRDFLESKLDKRYSLSGLYRCLEKSYCLGYQNILEDKVTTFAQSGPTISVLFFDVTTLYYESFAEDDFRKCGFSKDNKANQPQLIVTLTVTADGFPLHLRVFPGNKFEGHLMLPCIKTTIENHHLKDLVVVADSAMVSKANMEELEKNNLSYIVGARLGNLPHSLWTQVISVAKIDGTLERFSFGNDRFLIVSYNSKRASKDKSDREKQIKRAAFVLSHPAVVGRRYKFLRKTDKEKWELDRTNIQKAKEMEGLKGYVTNAANLTNEEIVEKYSSLWQVEKSFRISKSDLKARPIFHTVREKIEAHLAIVFAGLAMIKLVEKTSSHSIQKVLWLLDQMKEVIIEDAVNRERISKYSEIQIQETKDLLKIAKLGWGT